MRHIRGALTDHAEPVPDQMLVSVMLLALYETVTPPHDIYLNAWNRHVDGAVALIQLRGAAPAQKPDCRITNVNHITNKPVWYLINCLQRRARASPSLVSMMIEARQYETAQEEPTSKLADVLVTACDVLASVSEEVTNEKLPDLITKLLSVDNDLVHWSEKLPLEYAYQTVRVASPSAPEGPGNPNIISTCPYRRRHVNYPTVDVAHTWNLMRCEAGAYTHAYLVTSAAKNSFAVLAHDVDKPTVIIIHRFALEHDGTFHPPPGQVLLCTVTTLTPSSLAIILFSSIHAYT
ncbi:hypothetical protein BDW74DRAFT_183560 [Aspergillus multicolor]|uniref:uncharacterized protein n=1 Tax=Aspergillus multicolor TaxID=41759 RepID=UPI003CCDA2A6